MSMSCRSYRVTDINPKADGACEFPACRNRQTYNAIINN